MTKLLEATWAEVDNAQGQSWARAQREARKARIAVERREPIVMTMPDGIEHVWAEAEAYQGVTAYATTYGVWMRVPKGFSGPQQYFNKLGVDWFDERPLVTPDGRVFLPAAHNLVVTSGLHISALNTFSKIASDIKLDAVASSRNQGVRYGGVDNDVTAVTAATDRYNTTGANRFIRLFDSDPTYSTANKRITSLFTITNSDTTIIHRRYGQGNDTQAGNAQFSLLSMLSGFALDFGGNAYDITVEARTDWAGA